MLESYTGQNVFTFMLNTGGLNLYSLNGRYYLAESKTATDRIELGDLVTFDANGRFSVGTMTSQTISAGNIYRLTLTVDEDFLTDPDTVYPVSIDPTIRVSDDTTEGSIEDVNIYQGKPTLNANWSYMHVGHYDDTYGVGRILVRLTGLLNDEDYQTVEADEILTANFYLKEATGKAAAYIELYPHRGNSNWTETGVTWNTTGHTVGDIITTVSHPRSDWGCYDIKALLVDWKNGTNNANSGFVLRHSDEENATKGFYSSEYSTTDYRPYVVVTYTASVSQPISNGTYYINNLSTGKYIKYATSAPVGASGLIADIGNSIRWQIAWTGEAYTIRLASSPTKYLAVPTGTSSSSVETVTVSDGATVPERCLWTITPGAYGNFRLQSVYNSRYLASNNTVLYTSTTTPQASYNTYIWRFANISVYGNTASFTSRELTASTTFTNFELAKNGTCTITVNNYYGNELWASRSDFTYSIPESAVVTANGFVLTGNNLGGIEIIATHKVTNQSFSFYVVVGFSSSLSTTPFPSKVTAALATPYNIWPATSKSAYYNYTNEERTLGLVGIWNEAFAGATAVNASSTLLSDAANMLLYYISNSGTKYTVDFKRMISEWQLASDAREEQMIMLMQAVEASATYSEKTLVVMEAFENPFKESCNWGLAVGQYHSTIRCKYRKLTSSTYTMDVTYELYDCYDFDNSNTETLIDLVSSQMWELHHGGYAKNYEVYGINTFTFTWSAGQTFSEGMISNE